ncbi:hypothetical protein [uncultured Dysosmobacter sp.]|uniref:hypothetical protein n=1 Tax=uncultured Dysosmobacter sp. TaxID=2591384 RepID=UPI0026287F6C|nr:hypothetical protein [uncultured Dysosmobacter sp.]
MQVTDSEFAIATKAHIDILDKSSINDAKAIYEISDEMAETLEEISDAAISNVENNIETRLVDGVDLYLSDTWVSGYQNREYRTEYLSFRNSAPYTTIKKGFNTSVLEAAATLVIGFKFSGFATALTAYQILRDAFYDPTVVGSSTKSLQFAGDWGIVMVYTYIKAINYAEGAVGDALLRSIESRVHVTNCKFNVYTPGGNPANNETQNTSVGPFDSPRYNSTQNRQIVCYNRRLETMPLDESPDTLDVTVSGYTATINVTKGMMSAS